MPTKLTMLADEAEPDQYRVMGLPSGHSALIRFGNSGWWILYRDEPDQEGEWIGSYESAEVALAELETL